MKVLKRGSDNALNQETMVSNGSRSYNFLKKLNKKEGNIELGQKSAIN